MPNPVAFDHIGCISIDLCKQNFEFFDVVFNTGSATGVMIEGSAEGVL